MTNTSAFPDERLLERHEHGRLGAADARASVLDRLVSEEGEGKKTQEGEREGDTGIGKDDASWVSNRNRYVG